MENRGPGPRGDGTRAAAGSRKRPTGPHNDKKLRHRVNGDGKEPRSVPVLRLTFCFAALVIIFKFYMNLPYDTY
eukprot:scaffold62648_cov63-Attheya_sp.AAC.1